MALKQCKECGNTVSNQAKTCPHCGAPTLTTSDIAGQKRWYGKTGVTLSVAAGLIAIGVGFAHILTDSHLPFPHVDVLLKDSFGYSETFINVDKIRGMPWFSAISAYPIGCKVLLIKGYIDLADADNVVPIMRGRIDSAKWSEGKSAAYTIRAAARAFCAEKGPTYAYPETTLSELGFNITPGAGAGDLDGKYFTDEAYAITFTGYDQYTVTVTGADSLSGEAPSDPAVVTLNRDGDWTP